MRFAAVMAMIAVWARAAIPTTADGWYTPASGEFKFIGADATWTDRFGQRDGCAINADGEIVWGTRPADLNVQNALEYALSAYMQSSLNDEKIRTIGENLNDLTSKTGIEISSEHDPSVKYRITFGGQTIAGAAAGADGGILEARTSQGSFADGASLTWTGPTVDGASHGLELAGWHNAQATLPTLAAAAQYGSNPYMLVAKAGNSVKYVDIGTIAPSNTPPDGSSVDLNADGELQLVDWTGEGSTLGHSLSDWLTSSEDDWSDFATGPYSDIQLVGRSAYGNLVYVPVGDRMAPPAGDDQTIESYDDDGVTKLRLYGADSAAADAVPVKSAGGSLSWTELPPTVEYDESGVITISRESGEGPTQPEEIYLSDFDLTVLDGVWTFGWYALGDPEWHTESLDLGAVQNIDAVEVSAPEGYASAPASVSRSDAQGEALESIDFDIPYSAYEITGMTSGALSGNQRTYNFTGKSHDGSAIQTGTVTAQITEPQTDISSLTLSTTSESGSSTSIKATLAYIDKQGQSRTIEAPLTISKPITAVETFAVDGKSIDSSGVAIGSAPDAAALQLKGFAAGESCPGGHTLAKFARGTDTSGGEAAHKLVTRYESGDTATIHYLPIGDLPHPQIGGLLEYTGDGVGEFRIRGGENGQYLQTNARGAPVWADGPAALTFGGGLVESDGSVAIATDGASEGQVLTRTSGGVAWQDAPAGGTATNAVRWTGAAIAGGPKVDSTAANFDFPSGWAKGGLEQSGVRDAVRGVQLEGWDGAAAGSVPTVAGSGVNKALTWAPAASQLRVKGNSDGAVWVSGTNIVFETAEDSDVRVTATVENGVIHLKFGVHYK